MKFQLHHDGPHRPDYSKQWLNVSIAGVGKTVGGTATIAVCCLRDALDQMIAFMPTHTVVADENRFKSKYFPGVGWCQAARISIDDGEAEMLVLILTAAPKKAELNVFITRESLLLRDDVLTSSQLMREDSF